LSISSVTNPLSLPGFGLGENMFNTLEPEEGESLRNAFDSMGSDLCELRQLCQLVVGDQKTELPIKLREEALLLFGATLLEHEVSSCSELSSWIEECAGCPWSHLPPNMPVFAMLGELDPYANATASIEDNGAGKDKIQPRRWSVSVLEYAMRVLFPSSSSSGGPKESTEGVSGDEVMEAKHISSLHLAILAVAVHATDSKRSRGYGDGPLSEMAMNADMNGSDNNISGGDSYDPLGYSYGNEVRARALIRLGAAKWRNEFAGAKTRIPEDDETMLMLSAADWFADQSLTSAAQV
jgi:hypothetical protein